MKIKEESRRHSDDIETTLDLFIICFWMDDCRWINELNYEYIIEHRIFKTLKKCFPENEKVITRYYLDINQHPVGLKPFQCNGVL